MQKSKSTSKRNVDSVHTNTIIDFSNLHVQTRKPISKKERKLNNYCL